MADADVQTVVSSPKRLKLMMMDPIHVAEQKKEIAKSKQQADDNYSSGEVESKEKRQGDEVLGLKLTRTSSLMNLLDQCATLDSKNAGSSSETMEIPSSNNYTAHVPGQHASPAKLPSNSSPDSRSSDNSNQDKDKRKATNFSAIFIKIGTWERSAQYEGELTVKCYFAKKKLVWEVLEGGLKSKIEVQWSDITAIRAICPRHGPGTLEIQISKPPLFYKESDPQPRKHTVWQASSDFTDNQATVSRRHLLKFSQGVLDKHYEKLIQADPRLYALSKKPFISGDRPFFDKSKYRSGTDNSSSVWRLPDYMSRGLNPCNRGSLTDYSCNLSGLSVQTMVPVFDHFNPEEKLNSSNVDAFFSSRTNAKTTVTASWTPTPNNIQEIAEYLLSDSSLAMLNVNTNVTCPPQKHIF